MVGSGPAQQAMLSEGSDPANPPKQTFELNLYIKKTSTDDQLKMSVSTVGGVFAHHGLFELVGLDASDEEGLAAGERPHQRVQ